MDSFVEAKDLESVEKFTDEQNKRQIEKIEQTEIEIPVETENSEELESTEIFQKEESSEEYPDNSMNSFAEPQQNISTEIDNKKNPVEISKNMEIPDEVPEEKLENVAELGCLAECVPEKSLAAEEQNEVEELPYLTAVGTVINDEKIDSEKLSESEKFQKAEENIQKEDLDEEVELTQVLAAEEKNEEIKKDFEELHGSVEELSILESEESQENKSDSKIVKINSAPEVKIDISDEPRQPSHVENCQNCRFIIKTSKIVLALLIMIIAI
jgi:hypothetical protein